MKWHTEKKNNQKNKNLQDLNIKCKFPELNN